MEEKINIFEIVGIIFLIIVALSALYINMVSEPECQSKGYASVDIRGCWIMKNGERVYEK